MQPGSKEAGEAAGAEAETVSNPANAGTQENPGSDKEKELHQEVEFLKERIASETLRVESEPNEATREAMQGLIVRYQERLNDAERQLRELKPSGQLQQSLQ
jgi:hypothetical protein